MNTFYIIPKVCNLVGKLTIKDINNRFSAPNKQVSSTESRLPKDLFFFPGLPTGKSPEMFPSIMRVCTPGNNAKLPINQLPLS